MNSISFWLFIKERLNRNQKVVLLVVASSSNSSPGRQGFKMAVDENAELIGTIGGGIMEKELSEYALDMLFTGGNTDIKRLLHGESNKLESSGLICGGTQTVIFKVLDSTDNETVEKIIDNLNLRQPGLLTLTASEFSYNDTDKYHGIYFTDDESGWIYREQIGLDNTAYIVGGGHIGLAVSRIMKSIGFYVVVFDHREDVFTLEQNDFADKKIICNYSDIGKHIPEGEMSYVIIATPMHKGDSDALLSVINKKLKYIGLMGSKKKIKTIFDVMIDKGIDEKTLEKVHSPIGLEIEAETPEEIAISIAAEIITVKNT